MRSGYSPQNASKVAMQRIVKRHPDFQGAVVAVSKHGEIGEIDLKVYKMI